MYRLILHHRHLMLCWSWSSASRIRELISEFGILSFLASELDKEDNCTKVWMCIESHMLAIGITMIRVMINWKFFITIIFYHSIPRLKEFGTGWRGANILPLWKIYFSRPTSLWRLKLMRVKCFLRNNKTTYLKALELIHAEFCV